MDVERIVALRSGRYASQMTLKLTDIEPSLDPGFTTSHTIASVITVLNAGFPMQRATK